MNPTRRSLLFSGVSTAVLFYSVSTNAYILKGGGEAPPSPPPAGITSFSIQNYSGSTSKGYLQFGVPFKKGDVPSGSVPTITTSLGIPVTGIQFDQRSTWSDGSLKFAVAQLRDTTYSALEQRDYVIDDVVGSYNNTGIYTPADVAAIHDFKVDFASVTKYNGSTTTAYGSGHFLAEFNVAYLDPTSVTKVHSGPVSEGWEIWGMAYDVGTGLPDAHLKVIWHVDIIKNADGTVNDVKAAAEVAQDWWSVAGKYRLNYNATFKDGASTLYTYNTVQHPYQSSWATVRTNNDDNHARRTWLSSIPTLIYKPEKAYWITTGLIPPMDLTVTPLSNSALGYTANYVPLSNENQRAAIDGTGAYAGRGVITNIDTVAFLRQTSQDYRYCRTNGFAGLHVPYRYRSNDTRTRPGDASPSVANTVISMKLRPLSAGSYDFTAQGMPAAIDAYVQSSNGGIANTYVAKLGGNGVWIPSNSTSHAVAYSYFIYLLEGERYHLTATLGLATNCSHCRHGNTIDGAPKYSYAGIAPYQALLSIPATQYSGSPIGTGNSNSRQVGWGELLASQAAAMVPDDDVQAGFIRLFQSQSTVYAQLNMTYMPVDQLSQGTFQNVASGSKSILSPWMTNFQTLGFCAAYSMMEDTNAKSVLDNCLAKTTIGQWQNTATFYRASDYRNVALRYTDRVYDPSTNPFLALADVPVEMDVDIASDRITTSGYIPPTNGDVFYWSTLDANTSVVAVPPGFSLGVPYYAVNSSGYTCQLAVSPGGSPMAISGTLGAVMANGLAGENLPYMQYPPYLPATSDNYAMISRAMAVWMNRLGISGVTNTIVSRAKTFTDPNNKLTWMTWWYA